MKVAPDDSESRPNYGIALVNQKRFSEAEQQLRKAIKKEASSSTAHYYLGLALMNQKPFGAAEAKFRISITNSNGGIAAAHKYLGGI